MCLKGDEQIERQPKSSYLCLQTLNIESTISTTTKVLLPTPYIPPPWTPPMPWSQPTTVNDSGAAPSCPPPATGAKALRSIVVVGMKTTSKAAQRTVDEVPVYRSFKSKLSGVTHNPRTNIRSLKASFTASPQVQQTPLLRPESRTEGPETEADAPRAQQQAAGGHSEGRVETNAVQQGSMMD